MTSTSPPGWWERNWKWAVPSGCLFLLLLAAVGVGGLFYGVMSLMRNSDAYRLALGEVRRSPEAVAALGEPIEEGWFVSGNIHTSNDSGAADISFPVQGPKSAATVHVRASRAGGVWKLTYLGLELRNFSERVELIPEQDR